MKGERNRAGTSWHGDREGEPGTCPTCEVSLSGASAVDHEHDHPPKAGDLTICTYCGELAFFTGEGLNMRAATEEERRECMTDPDVIKAVLLAREFIERYPAVVAERIAAAQGRKFLRSLEGHLNGERNAGRQAPAADVHDVPGTPDADRAEGPEQVTD